MAPQDRHHRFRVDRISDHAYGFRIEHPPNAASLNATILSLQIAARACALHDEGVTVTRIVSHPRRKPGIAFTGESGYDAADYGRDAARDPVMVEAARRYLEHLSVTWTSGPGLAAAQPPPHDVDPHGLASAYVRSQWERIAYLAQQLIDHEGVLSDPVIMPPFSTEPS
jgi:hypothetical protein